MKRLERLYRRGDLVEVHHSQTPCNTGTAVVVSASRAHCINIGSLGGSLPEGCNPYYQILKLLSRGKEHVNVHSHNVRLLAAAPKEA